MIPESSRQHARIPPTHQIQSPGGSNLRKRGRNESSAGLEVPLASGLSGGDRSPNAKRAKNQASAAETFSPSRRRKDPAAPYSSEQINATSNVNSEQPSPDLNLPNVTSDFGPVDGLYGSRDDGNISTNGPTDIFSRGLGLRTQSLPVLDNFVSRNTRKETKLLTLPGNPNTEYNCQIVSSRTFKHDGCISNRRQAAMVHPNDTLY